jgi:hypothetical protein
MSRSRGRSHSKKTVVDATSSAIKNLTPPPKSPKTPSRLNRLASYLRRAWAFEERWRRRFVRFVLRPATYLSLAYLLYNSLYQTGASVAVAFSDPRFPLASPFQVTNNSNLYNMKNASLSCRVGELNFGQVEWKGGTFIAYNKPQLIPIGETLNFFCRVLDVVGPSLREGSTIEIVLQYDINILGIPWISWHLHPNPSLFTWVTGRGVSQWVKGPFAKK